MLDNDLKPAINLRAARDDAVVNSTNPTKVQGTTSEFEILRFQILVRMPEFLVGSFGHLVERRAAMNDQLQAKNLTPPALR
jgi:hypothetical protein